MPVITIVEVLAGVCCTIGLVKFIVDGGTQLGLIGAQLSALSIVALFFGQRLAQEYEGAATLTTYFLIACLGIYVMS